MGRAMRLGCGIVVALGTVTGALAQVSPPGLTIIEAPPGEENKDRSVPMPERRPAKLDANGGVPLLPRSILFGNPDKAQARISPDGKQVAFLAPLKGVMNVWVGPADDISKSKAVTDDDKRGIPSFRWAYTNDHIMFIRDKGGDENWRIFSAELSSGKTTDLTPLENTQARFQQVSEKFPDEIIVALNDRNRSYHDLHKINVRTGERALVLKNELKDDPARGHAAFVVDDDYRVRLAMLSNKDGSMAVLRAVEGGKAGFEPFFTIPMQDVNSTNIVGMNKDASKAYMVDSRGRDTAGLFEMDLASGKAELLFEDDRCDVSDVLLNPVTKKIEGAETEYERKKWSIMDPDLQYDLMAVRKESGLGDISVTSRSKDDRVWTVVVVKDEGPSESYIVKRGKLGQPNRQVTAKRLFVSRPELVGKELSPMHPVMIQSRDGMTLVSYLTLPLPADPNKTGRPSKPVPMVLYVHGGPWSRDSWGLSSTHQWLANRGYAVLSVNFRASTGFGKKFANAANLEWAGKMHDDLLDAVNWAVAQKFADPKKVAIMGGSYGGYATLVGLTFTPDVFACGVDIVGPSNLATLLGSIPPYWEPMIELMTKQVGDHRTEDGRKLLESRSPLTFVDRIKRPLLIGQGKNDPRVKEAESDQIVKAMQAKSIPVTYVLFPDEGHGFAKPENRLSFYAVAENFLAQHLGGRAEPIGGDFKGSSIMVPAGAEQVKGLQEALSVAATPGEPAKLPGPAPAKD